MIITVYSGKGGVGKTPISVNLALEHGWGIGTNDPMSVLSILPNLEETQYIEIEPHEEFPEIPDSYNIIFDLGGALSHGSKPSILSALEQSDLIIVPVCNDMKSIAGTVITLNEIAPFKKPTLLVATKLTRSHNEPSAIPIEQTKAFLSIREKLNGAGYKKIPMLPLKLSTAFEAIFESGKSIEQLSASNGLTRYHYASVVKQLEAINTHIRKYGN